MFFSTAAIILCLKKGRAELSRAKRWVLFEVAVERTIEITRIVEADEGGVVVAGGDANVVIFLCGDRRVAINAEDRFISSMDFDLNVRAF